MTDQQAEPFFQSQDDTSISCIICQAIYTPSPNHISLLQSPAIALESAFMSMCHFCFRCRRPSCPSCWDHVHAVCGMCALEAQLPFRSELASLRSRFTPNHLDQTIPTSRITARLVCIQPGRFQGDLVPSETVTTIPLRAMARQRARQANRQAVPAIENIKTQPERHTSLPIDEMATRPQSHSYQHSPTNVTVARQVPLTNTQKTAQRPAYSNATGKGMETPEKRDKIDKEELSTQLTRPPRSKKNLPPTNVHPQAVPRFFIALERIFSAIALATFIFICLLITAALASPQANETILAVLHLDIQAEINYLWHLIRSLHF